MMRTVALKNTDFEVLKEDLQLLKPKPIDNSLAEFWKLESAVWFGSSQSLVVLKGFLIASFRRNYHIMKRAFKSLPAWTQIKVPHADNGLLGACRWLSDTGINVYWGELQGNGTMGYESHKFLAIRELKGPDLKETLTPAVRLEESLILEALFLYGVGIVLGSLSLLGQVIRSNHARWVRKPVEFCGTMKTLRIGKRTQRQKASVNCFRVLGVRPGVKLRPLRLLQKVTGK